MAAPKYRRPRSKSSVFYSRGQVKSVVMLEATFPFSVVENGRMPDLQTHVRAHPTRSTDARTHVRTWASSWLDTEGRGRDFGAAAPLTGGDHYKLLQRPALNTIISKARFYYLL